MPSLPYKMCFSAEMLRFDEFFEFANQLLVTKRNISAEKRVLYCKLGQYKKIRETAAGHLYQGLDQSPQTYLMFGVHSCTSFFYELRIEFWSFSSLLLHYNIYLVYAVFGGFGHKVLLPVEKLYPKCVLRVLKKSYSLLTSLNCISLITSKYFQGQKSNPQLFLVLYSEKKGSVKNQNLRVTETSFTL